MLDDQSILNMVSLALARCPHLHRFNNTLPYPMPSGFRQALHRVHGLSAPVVDKEITEKPCPATTITCNPTGRTTMKSSIIRKFV